MAHKYRLLERLSSEELSNVVTERLANEWELWGNPFVVEIQYLGHYFQAMVRFDPSGHTVAGKIETLRQAQGDAALDEPAGYTVQVPETPSADDFRDLGAAIGSMQTCGEGQQP